MQGFVVLDKPVGITSMKAVSRVKSALMRKDVGHLGTLDPLASGVLPVAVGKATRLFDYFLHKSKEYIADFEFGYLTTTLDVQGEVVERGGNIPSYEQILSVLPSLSGEIMQIPPKYSAKHIDGQRAYDLAREGKDFEIEPCRVNIYRLELIGALSQSKFRFLIECSGGTYIRSIARDMGAACAGFCTMTALRRTRSGCFSLEQSIGLDDVEQASIISIESALGLPKYEVQECHYRQLANGVAIRAQDAPQGSFLVYGRGQLFGVAQCDRGEIKIRVYLKENV